MRWIDWIEIVGLGTVVLVGLLLFVHVIFEFFIVGY